MSLDLKIVLTIFIVFTVVGLFLGSISAYLSDKTKLKRYNIGIGIGATLMVIGGLTPIGWLIFYMWGM